METNEVTNVATDGGESLALGEMEELSNEDTNTASSSSTSNEEIVAQEISKFNALRFLKGQYILYS